MKPNPTIGIAEVSACRLSCCQEGTGTLATLGYAAVDTVPGAPTEGTPAGVQSRLWPHCSRPTTRRGKAAPPPKRGGSSAMRIVSEESDQS